MPPSDGVTAHLLELLSPLGAVTARRMFGGVGLFHSGLMFGLIARDELYFKVGDSNRAAYEGAGEGPFSYGTKNGTNTITSYWRCPPDLLDEPEVLQDWARQALDVAMRADAKRTPSRRKTKA